MRRARGALWLALAVAAAAVGRGQLRRVEVTGESMAPGLQPGDRLLVRRTRRHRVGDVVAVPDPRVPARTLVKRVAAVLPDRLVVVGDNPSASTDSRHFGPVARRAVRGRVWYRYRPSHRQGRLPRGGAADGTAGLRH